ncbi:MAG: hypothetical protein KKC68_06310 [Candidatus Thermoplasmatota archaeon]|nr:hypothetical protein [Candidatus Thermoplasmatota archaeon]MBU1941371.1 hypothetical protein [Candidatus Thermoplasmatota archaeon]
MKKYLVYLAIVPLLCFGSFASANSVLSNEGKKPLSFDDDVPIWAIGDQWIYTLNDFKVDYSATGQKLFLDGTIDDFTWTVSSTAGSDYEISFTGEINADYIVYFASSSATIYVEGTLTPALTRMTGTLLFTQSSLEVKDITAEIRGISMARIDPLPFALPIPFKISIDGDLSTVFPVFDFPLGTNKFWALPTVDIVMRANIGGIFGLVSFPVTFTTGYTWTPFAFHCHGTESVSVPAGTFNAYKITSIFGSFFEYYYAPIVGNLIKIDATLPNGEVHGVLKDTNYI